MLDYAFCENSIASNHNIFFLCGTEYESDSSDKRNVLKNFLEGYDNSYAIILEKNFAFKTRNKKYLSYDSIYLKNLSDIETLTALLSDYVFVIHESKSTAAELGMFASNDLLASKICILVPNEDAVEEKKISRFMRMAFMLGESKISSITFYPSIEAWRISECKCDYHTYFVQNKIGVNLAKSIEGTIARLHNKKTMNIRVCKSRFSRNMYSVSDTISFYVNENDNIAHVFVPAIVIRYQIIALFNLPEFRGELRKEKKIYEHVNYVSKKYHELLANAIKDSAHCSIANVVIEEIRINGKGNTIEYKKVVGYVLYLLQALEKITFVCDGAFDLRRIQISNDFIDMYNQYNGLIKNYGQSTYGSIIQ